MITAALFASSWLTPHLACGTQANHRQAALDFLRALEIPCDAEQIGDGRGDVPGKVSFLVLDTHSVHVRVRDGKVTSYHNWKISGERSSGRRREVSLALDTEGEAHAKAQRLLVALGLDDEFEITEVRLDPEEVSTKDPRRMASYGTAHVKARKIGDPPSLRGSNGWSVSFDRFDGAVFSYGMSDHLRFVEEPDHLGEAGARRAAEDIWAEIDRLDPEAFPPSWRPVSKVEQGWSIVGDRWMQDYRQRHGSEPGHIPVVPAYKVWFSNPLREGQTEPRWAIFRASNGELMHDGRF